MKVQINEKSNMMYGFEVHSAMLIANFSLCIELVKKG